MMTPALILASASPRRQAFLNDLGLTFTVLSADIDETPLENEAPAALAARLAAAKARAVAARLAGGGQPALIVAADTVVALDQHLLGKPADAADARAMLAALRGRDHFVVSAISVLETPSGRQHARVNSTRVTMRVYSNEEIDAYIATGDPFDKAGAYAIQHKVFHPVAAISGCMAGVMGLPLADLRDLLAEFGMNFDAPLAPICQRETHFACCQVTPTQALEG